MDTVAKVGTYNGYSRFQKSAVYTKNYKGYQTRVPHTYVCLFIFVCPVQVFLMAMYLHIFWSESNQKVIRDQSEHNKSCIVL